MEYMYTVMLIGTLGQSLVENYWCSLFFDTNFIDACKYCLIMQVVF